MTFDMGNVTGISSMFLAANDFTGGVFGVMLLLMVWAVTFFSTKNYPTPLAFAFATTISAVTAILFFAIGLISTGILALAILLGSIAVVYLFTLNKTTMG